MDRVRILTDGADEGFPPSPRAFQLLTQLLPNTVWRRGQMVAISSAMKRKSDIIVLFPPGSGKGLIYQIPAIHDNENGRGTSLVLLPDASVMTGEVEFLWERQVEVMLFTDEFPRQNAAYLQDLRANRYPPLLVTSFKTWQNNQDLRDAVLRLHNAGKLARFVLRQSDTDSMFDVSKVTLYESIFTHIENDFHGVPKLMVSGPVSDTSLPVIKKITIMLKMSDRDVHVCFLPPDLPNITFTVHHMLHKEAHTIEYIKRKHNRTTGVLYTNNEASCETLAGQLRLNGVKAEAYTSALPFRRREELRKCWGSNVCHIIVTTPKLAMAMKNLNVRFCVFVNVPETLHALYHACGRVGRDGQPADCVIYYTFSDAHHLYTRALGDAGVTQSSEWNQTAYTQMSVTIHKIFSIFLRPTECRRFRLLAHFHPEWVPKRNCQGCDVCRGECKADVVNVHGIAMALLRLLRRVHARYPFSAEDHHMNADRLARLYLEPSSSATTHEIARRCNWNGAGAQVFGNGNEVTIPALKRLVFHMIVERVYMEYPRDVAGGTQWYLSAREGERLEDFLRGNQFPLSFEKDRVD